MADQIWDAERLHLVGSVVSRYGEHIAPGHRIRMGLEGDPCNTYGDAAPCGVVLDVSRDEANRYVTFRACLDGSEEVVTLDNRNVAPHKVWEVEPSFLPTFRSAVERKLSPSDETRDEARDAARDAARDEARPSADDTFRATLESYEAQLREQDEQLRSMRESLERLSATDAEFRGTMGKIVRELAGDLLRSSRGDSIEFAYRYADRYDQAYAGLADDAEGASRHEQPSASRAEDARHESTDAFRADDTPASPSVDGSWDRMSDYRGGHESPRSLQFSRASFSTASCSQHETSK